MQASACLHRGTDVNEMERQTEREGGAESKLLFFIHAMPSPLIWPENWLLWGIAEKKHISQPQPTEA